MRLLIVTTAGLLTALLNPPSPAGAAQVAGVEFRDQLVAQSTPLQLQGAGLQRYRVFFRAYAAALYLGDGVEPARALADVPRRLEIEYFWSIPADGFAKATLAGIRKNVDRQSFEALRERIDQMNGLYADVEPGDRYALTYVPGIGTTLSLNGEPKGVIQGADFAVALFSIWLGEAPFDASLKSSLLGGRS